MPPVPSTGGTVAFSYRSPAIATGAGAYPAGRVVNVPRPWVRLRSRVAYPNSSARGTVAVITTEPARGAESETRPRRAARSPSTPPTASAGTVTVTSATGSRSPITPVRSASRSASRPAVRNAISEESLEWVAPSVRVTPSPVTG